MIEDKSIGLVVAENEDEKMWFEIKENTVADIAKLKKLLKFQEAVLELAETKLLISQNA